MGGPSGLASGSDPATRSQTSGFLSRRSSDFPVRQRFLTLVLRYLEVDSMIVADEIRKPERFASALRPVIRRYAAQVRLRPGTAIPALLLPGIGDVLATFYILQLSRYCSKS